MNSVTSEARPLPRLPRLAAHHHNHPPTRPPTGVVNAEQLAEAAKGGWAVVLPFEVHRGVGGGDLAALAREA